MLASRNISDISLPPKTLCLTYDDGPGPGSAEIGSFLASRGVRATFFVVGKFALEHPEVLDALHADGHIIGNHTFEHPDMPYYVSVAGDIRDQVIRTNTLIQKYNQGRATYLRATYGKWSPEVAAELNVDLRSSFRHVGPIYWDIGGVDCLHWRLGHSVEEAAADYLRVIEEKGRGVIVMHDGIADMEAVATRNLTPELTRMLIPMLQERGYRFVGLDEIDDPQLTDALNDSFALQGQNGRFLRCTSAADDAVLDWSGRRASDGDARFVLEVRAHGKVVLRAGDGRCLWVDPESDPTVRLRAEPDAFSVFDQIPVRDGQFMLRSHNGNYLAAESAQGGRLQANAPYMRQAWGLRFVPGHAYLKPLGFADKLDLMKRRLRFVKSKLLQS